MKKILFLSVLFLVFSATSSFALFVEVPYNQPGLTPAYYTFDNGSYREGVGSYAGAFVLNFKQNANSGSYFSTFGFCVDLPVPDGSGTADFKAITTNDFKKAAWLLEKNYSNANNIYQNAGLQLAIWDVIYDTPLADGSDVFIPDADGSQVYNAYKAYHDDYLDNIGDVLTDFDTFADKYIIVDFEDGDIQDMITRNPVPEPTTIALFSIGLLGITLVGRKRR